MKSSAFKSIGKNKLAKVSLLSVLIFGSICGTLLVQNQHGADAATALCQGQPGTHTAVTPASVTPGQTFSITNLTGSANTNISNVISTTLSLSVTGATPSTITESWNGGPVHGNYQSTYSDFSLTATGSVGSQIKINLSSITAQITISGSPFTVTCSVAGGTLTANQAGQSLELASIDIVSPPPQTPPNGGSTGSNSTNTQTTTTNTNKKTTATPKSTSQTTQPTVATSTQHQTTANSNTQTTQNLIITVNDYHDHPVKTAAVVIDSKPPVTTDATGKASFSNLTIGNHDLTVNVDGQTITRVIKVDPQTDSKVLGIQVKLPAPSNRVRNILLASAATVLLLLLGLGSVIRSNIKKKPKAFEQFQPPAATNLSVNQTLTSPQVISPATEVGVQAPPDDQTIGKP